MILNTSLFFFFTVDRLFYSHLAFWASCPSIIDAQFALIYPKLKISMLKNIKKKLGPMFLQDAKKRFSVLN